MSTIDPNREPAVPAGAAPAGRGLGLAGEPLRGLYDTAFEKDSCGFGIIANLDDHASHWLVQTALVSLERLEHRGATAADGKTGDGCGILLKQPTAFLRLVAAEAGITLASAIHNESSPRTRSLESTTAPGSVARPMRQVPTGWKIVVPISPASRASSASDWNSIPGLISCGR